MPDTDPIRRKSVSRNYIFNLICQVSTILISLFTIPYASRVLLDTGVGEYSYAESMASYFVLFSALGSSTYAQREIGRAGNDRDTLSRTFFELLILRAATTVIALAAYAGYLFIQSGGILLPLILALNVVGTVFDITWFFQGIEDFEKTSVIGTVFRLLNFILIVLFVKSEADLWIYAVIQCGSLVASHALVWSLLRGKIKRVRGLRPLRHLKGILILFIPTIAVQVYTVLDKSMIGWFSGDTYNENGYYEYAEKIVRMSITLIYALSNVMLSRVANAHATGDEEGVRRCMYGGLSYTWMLSFPLIFGVLGVADIFVPVYLGEPFLKTATLMMILSPIILFVGMAYMVGQAFLIPIGRQNVNVIAIVIAAVINFTCNAILIPRLLSVGAAIASVIAEGVGIAIQMIYVFRHRLLSAKTVFLSSLRYLIAAGVMFAAIFLAKEFLPIGRGIPALILLVAGGGCIYFLALLVMRDPFFLSLLRRVLSFLKIKRGKQNETK